MEFQTPYKRRNKDLDAGGGPIIVELAGYVPVQRRIKEMIDAGKRLVEHRTAEAYYHFSTGENPDLDFWDPTLEKGYDLADATQDTYSVHERLRTQEKAAKASKKQSEGGNTPEDKEAPSEALKQP